MATQSTWRTQTSTNGGGAGGGGASSGVANAAPRWGPNANGGHQVQHGSAPSAVVNGTASGRPLSPQKTATAKTNNGEDDSVQRDRMMYLLVGLIGNTVEVNTHSGSKYVGILSSTSTPDDTKSATLGVVLSCAQQVRGESTLGPLQKTLLINGQDLDSIVAREVGLDAPVSLARVEPSSSFRTDTEISQTDVALQNQGRSLQKWSGDPSTDVSLNDDAPSSGGAWDQFAANEAKFGVKSNYEESMYTTKLDRSTKDYKERERKADQLAREILSSSAGNSHIAEERNLVEGEAAGAPTEEDKYGAVVRAQNAYVPPGARKAAAAAAVAATATASARQNGANGPVVAEDTATSSTAPSIVTTGPAPTGESDKTAMQIQQQQDAVGEFRQFVVQERERVERKKAALARKEMNSTLADFKKWSTQFDVKYKKAEGESTASSSGNVATKKAEDATETKEKRSEPTIKDAKAKDEDLRAAVTSTSTATTKPPVSTTAARLAEAKASLASMTIPKIPPYNPEKAKARQAEAASKLAASTSAAQDQVQAPDSKGLPASSSKSAFKLSAKASAFKPFNPNAASFTPGASTSAASRVVGVGSPGVLSPNLKSDVPAHPFFGHRTIKKTPNLHVRDAFNPFKTGKVPDASTVGPMWGFTGKPYRQLFHVIPSDDAGMYTHVSTPQQGHSAPSMGSMPSSGMHSPLGQATPPQIGQPMLHQQMGQHMQSHMAQAGAAIAGQPIYMPYAPYRFPSGQQAPMQHIAGAPYGIGPQFVGQIPFTPQMPPGASHLYSPQMQNMMGVPPPNMMPVATGGPPQRGSTGGGSSNGGGGGKGGLPPQQMYYQASQPMPGMPYGSPYPVPSSGPSPVVRHQQHVTTGPPPSGQHIMPHGQAPLHPQQHPLPPAPTQSSVSASSQEPQTLSTNASQQISSSASEDVKSPK